MSQSEDPWAEERREIVAKYEKGRADDAKIEPWEDPSYELYQHVDYHGFIHDAALTQKIKEADEKVRKHDLKREAKWKKLGSPDYLDKCLQNARVNEKLVRGIYKGIPRKYRMLVWKRLLKTDEIKKQKQGVYQRMLELALNHSPDIRQIDLDVNRTFRNTFYFRDRYGNRQKALFDVLAAYSMYNIEIGYCQGMSQLAGLMLIYLIEEEDAFWAISQMMTLPPIQMHGFFICEFPKLIRFFEHHDKVLQKLEPRLAQHFDHQDVRSSTYALKWFMQCFLDRVPMSLCLRLWDIYLLEGEKLLITMSYNILKMHKKRLLKMDQNQILIFLQSELPEDFLYDDNVVINSLKDNMAELRKANLLDPGKPPPEELPRLPFGHRLPNTPIQVITNRHEQQADVAQRVQNSVRKKTKHNINRNEQKPVEVPPESNINAISALNHHIPTEGNPKVHGVQPSSPNQNETLESASYSEPIQRNGGDRIYLKQTPRLTTNDKSQSKTEKYNQRMSTGFLEEKTSPHSSNPRVTSMPNGFTNKSPSEISRSSYVSGEHTSSMNHANNSQIQSIEELVMQV